VVARNLEHSVRAEAVDAVSRRRRPVDVDENAHRVHGPWRGPTAGEGGSRDFDVEGKGPEVRRDSEPDDVHVRVEDATRGHRFRGHGGPVVELTVDLNR